MKIRTALSFALVLSSTAAFAADAGPARKLTLDEAMDLAAKTSPDLAAAAERVVQSQEDVRSSYAFFLPQIEARGSYLWFNKDIPLNFALPQPSPNPPLVIDTGIFLQKSPTYQGQVTGTLPLLNPDAFPTLAAARHGERATEHAVFAGKQELLYGVAQAYWANLVTAQLVKSADEAVANAHELSRVAGEQVKAQVTTNLALFRAKAAEEQAAQFAIAARGGQAQAQAALRRLTGIEGPIEVETPAPQEAGQIDEDALWKKAIALRPDLRASDEAAKARISLYHGRFNSYLPTIAAQAEYHYTSNPGFLPDHDGSSYGLVASWKLFDGNLREQKVARAASQARQAGAEYQATERKAREEVSKAVTDLKTALATRDAAKEGAEFARQAQGLAQSQYRAGTATNLEVTQANATLLQAEAALAQAEAQAALAQLALKKASGTPLR